MFKKRMLALLGAAILCFSMIAVPASAATGSDEMYASMGGGATVSATAVVKSAAGGFGYTAKPYIAGGWSPKGDEWVYFRGRSEAGSQATELHHHCYSGYTVTGKMPYNSGFGYIGSKYRLAIEYDNENPYEYVDLYVTWTP